MGIFRGENCCRMYPEITAAGSAEDILKSSMNGSSVTKWIQRYGAVAGVDPGIAVT